MTRLTWGDTGQRFYEVGVDHGVLYVDDAGVAWSGLVSIEEAPSGGDAKAYYLDGVKYLNLSSREEFEATISAFYSPMEFDVCDGLGSTQPGLFAAQQRRKSFGLSYRTKIGNDLDGDNHAYKIHVIYNALAQPSKKNYASIADNHDAPLLAWDITTKPVFVPGSGYSAHLIVDTTTAVPFALQMLEDILYGDDENVPRLPTATEMVAIFENAGPLTVTDIGNDQFHISGSGLVVMALDDDTYRITADTVINTDADSAQISSE